MLIVLSLASALAQSTDVVPETAAPRQVFQAVTIIEYKGVGVDGKRDGPGVAYAIEPKRGTHPSLIVLRANFDDEMENSVGRMR